MAARKTRNLSETEIEDILTRKLARQSVRTIAEEVGCAPGTVVKHWNDWLDETSDERRDQLERQRSESIRRLDHIATTARKRADHADTDGDVAKLLNVERQAIAELGHIAGHRAPQQIQMTGGLTLPSEEEAARILDEIDELDAK